MVCRPVLRWWLGLLTVCLASSGCYSVQAYRAAHRASREFACPVDAVRLLYRGDVASGLFDVEACGNRARYVCFTAKRTGRCIREPDPSRWSPDPKNGIAFSDLPRERPKRICREKENIPYGGPCVAPPK